MTQKLVIKVGGALLSDSAALSGLLDVIVSLQSQLSAVLVHGGGDTVQSLLEKLNFDSHKIDGIRVTPEEQIPYVSGALAGTVNTQLCAVAITKGLKPVGMTSATTMDKAFGAVGTVKPAESALLEQLCQSRFLPVISSIACTEDGQILNINADDAASVIAQLIGADLALLSDVPGVLDADKQLIPELNSQQIDQYCQQNVIQGGMVVKVKSALETAIATEKSVFISSWKTPESLLALIERGAESNSSESQKRSCGTRIYSDSSFSNSTDNSLQEV
jgi:acetylglutamate kinase